MNKENSESFVPVQNLKPTSSPNQIITSEAATDPTSPNAPLERPQAMSAVGWCRACCCLLYFLLAMLSIPVAIVLPSIASVSPSCSFQKGYGCERGCFLNQSNWFVGCKFCEDLDETSCRDIGKGTCEWSDKYTSCKASSCSGLAKLFDSGNFSFAYVYGNDSYNTAWAREYCHKMQKCLFAKSRNRCSPSPLWAVVLAAVVTSLVVVVVVLSVLIVVCYKRLLAKERARSTHVVYNGEMDEMDVEAAAMTNRLREQNINEVITGRDLRANFKLDEGEKI